MRLLITEGGKMVRLEDQSLTKLQTGGHGAHSGELDSFYLIERSGSTGRRWVKEYRRPKCLELERVIDSALVHLRLRAYEQGWSLLSEADAKLAYFVNEPESVVRLLEHRYYGVLAYAFYCVDDLEAATRFVGLAEQSLAAAINGRAYLIPLAARFLDFGFQRVRIARRRQSWLEMKVRIEKMRGMLSDQIPLCLLADGTAIYISTLIRFYESIELTDEERRFLEIFFGERSRIQNFERSVYKIYTLSGPVIPYP